MVESTRVAIVGNSPIEIHLKKNIEITSDIASQVAQLPTGDPWVLLRYNSNNDQWLNAETFDGFIDADDAFVQKTKGQGIQEVGRLEAGKPGRTIEEDGGGGGNGGPGNGGPGNGGPGNGGPGNGGPGNGGPP